VTSKQTKPMEIVDTLLTQEIAWSDSLCMS
jgi:hypothetical protein